jgi:hypothetical protein
MNVEIFEGAFYGLIGGIIIALLFKSKKQSQQSSGNIMSNNINNQHNDQKSLIDRWSVKLALLGIAAGIFTTLGMGYTSIGFMIGFGLPMAFIFGIVGLIIDAIKDRKK